MHYDNLIMGVCGETRIANKRQSWVTAIQVYEYFISHHLAKAFESVFGGVTCLPGCFSMYRLKARKAHEDDWVPLLVKPEIVREYSQSVVTTLHQKNLLLLGEDRFLTTILLRTFPNRKMMFCPQAKCRTVAPDAFAVLLSQRRRWINSTIHNLMELVRVRNLCGTFCFSMQFVVFMDLLGTVVLPVAISLTYALVASMVLDPPNTFEKAIPLMLLLAVIGLPAVLILITTRKVVYVFWMFIYLAALPIWNFVLPVYSFWHFDDFSWGETRFVTFYLADFWLRLFLHRFPDESRAKANRRDTTMRGTLWQTVHRCLCGDGKIGSGRGCANFDGKRSGNANSSGRSLPLADSLLLDTTRWPCRIGTILQTLSRSPRQRKTSGAPKSARTTKTKVSGHHHL
jgi:cellulose synthase/poly-beta-1,6-N-acetylglucosamine synthase-like glycosyltransferase